MNSRAPKKRQVTTFLYCWRFVEGVDRGQTTLFPECLEDWIGEDNQFAWSTNSIWPSLGLVGSIPGQPADPRIIPRSC